MFCAGMVRGSAFHSSVVLRISINTEAAPNSYTRSGPGVFPHQDGFILHSSFQGKVGRRASETSPCHMQAKQNGKLDPRRAAIDRREHSRGLETATELVVVDPHRIGSVR
jgi:hypothetical protein